VIRAEALAAALLLAAPADAQPAPAPQPNWRVSARDSDFSDVIDTASIRRDGDKVRFTYESRFASPRVNDGTTFDTLGVTEEMDCRARTTRLVELYFVLAGRELRRAQSNGADVMAVEPGTLLDAHYQAVCLNRWAP
jgi:hypothetical protein